MQPIRLDEPILPTVPKKTRKKKRSKGLKHIFRENKKKKELLGDDYVPTGKSRDWSWSTPEIRVKYMANRYKKSKRFKKQQIRFITTSPYTARATNTKIVTCPTCGKERSIKAHDFTNDPKAKSKTRRSYCFMCRRRMNRAYYLKNKERLKEKQKERYEKACNAKKVH